MRYLLLSLLILFQVYGCDEPDPKRRKLNDPEFSEVKVSQQEIALTEPQVQDEPPYLQPPQNGQSPIQHMPLDIIKHILGYIRPIKLGTVMRVDRRMRHVGEELRQKETFWFNVVREKDREDLKKYLQTTQESERQLKIGINGFGLPAKMSDILSNTKKLLEGQEQRLESLRLRFIANEPYLMIEGNDEHKDFESILMAVQQRIIFLDCRKMIFSNLTLFSQLCNIEYLSLQVVNIDSAEALHTLSKLTGLRIVSDSLKDFSALRPLTLLRTLELRCEKLIDFSFLQSMPHLVEINLSGCNRFEDLSLLKNVTHLENLIIKDTSVKFLAPLSLLSSLLHLDISDTKVKSLKVISSLIQLRSLAGVKANPKLLEQVEALHASNKLLKIY